MNFESKFDSRSSSVFHLEANTISEVAAQLSTSPVKQSTLLTGGFRNTNILLEFTDGERCVLRVSPHQEQLQMEADLLDFVSREAPDIPVPKIIWRAPDRFFSKCGAIVMSYVDGQPLATIEDDLSTTHCRSICEQLAAVAAQIHAIRFDQSGLLGPGPKVTQPFENCAAATLEFFQLFLDDFHLQRRVGSDRLRRLRDCVTHRSDLHQPSLTNQLCHSDFNQKNLLMKRHINGSYRLAAVLDWEFALSASGVIDIGNLLRFEHESPAVQSDWFADAYRLAGGHLDKAWRQQSLFADLLAQCAFLINIEELPKTFSTAIEVIDRTLAVLQP